MNPQRNAGNVPVQEVETCERNKRRRASGRSPERRIQELNSTATASDVVRGLFGLRGDNGLVCVLSFAEPLCPLGLCFSFLYIFLPLCDTKGKKREEWGQKKGGKNKNIGYVRRIINSGRCDLKKKKVAPTAK